MHHLPSHRAGFPGSQPVSMDVKNMYLLRQMPYRVSWKADGTRYLMLIRNENEVYMVDRDNAVFRINKVVFPSNDDPNQGLKDTLIDGVCNNLRDYLIAGVYFHSMNL